jgi:hypothetical protein
MNSDDKQKRPSDQEGQDGSNIEKMGNRNVGRDHIPAVESGSKEDHKPVPTREDLDSPLSGETERSGTHMDQ